VFLAENGTAGTTLGSAPVEFRRPGWGMGPDEFERLSAMKLRRNLPKGHMLTYADLE
jgi:sialic acid synthase SpsE